MTSIRVIGDCGICMRWAAFTFCVIVTITSNLGKFSRWTLITTLIMPLIKIFSLVTCPVYRSVWQ
ncbi:putative CMP170.5L-like protein [synthetic Vaccinia virus]|nr:putative CMP170.5L-like protein [synthetic Vaccinia virus]